MKSGPKRFYKSVEVDPHANGFALLLDGKAVKTPLGKHLVSPARALADAIAAEWSAQEVHIVPDAMPLTKALNTALDRVGAHRDAVVEELANFAGSDLLCYRAASPVELVRRQSQAWDPWLDWAAERFGARLKVVTGLTHVQQPPDAMARLAAAIAKHDDYRLTALHPGVTITGSVILGLAFAAGALSAEAAFEAAQVDETYQAEQWGRDAEAEVARARCLADLRASQRFLELIA